MASSAASRVMAVAELRRMILKYFVDDMRFNRIFPRDLHLSDSTGVGREVFCDISFQNPSQITDLYPIPYVRIGTPYAKTPDAQTPDVQMQYSQLLFTTRIERPQPKDLNIVFSASSLVEISRSRNGAGQALSYILRLPIFRVCRDVRKEASSMVLANTRIDLRWKRQYDAASNTWIDDRQAPLDMLFQKENAEWLWHIHQFNIIIQIGSLVDVTNPYVHSPEDWVVDGDRVDIAVLKVKIPADRKSISCTTGKSNAAFTGRPAARIYTTYTNANPPWVREVRRKKERYIIRILERGVKRAREARVGSVISPGDLKAGFEYLLHFLQMQETIERDSKQDMLDMEERDNEHDGFVFVGLESARYNGHTKEHVQYPPQDTSFPW